jgi:hypothetical protein
MTETPSVLSPYIEINQNWIKDFNVKPETLKLLEENIGETFQDRGIDNCFLNMALIAHKIIANQQIGLQQLKKLLHHK